MKTHKLVGDFLIDTMESLDSGLLTSQCDIIEWCIYK